MTNNEGAPLSFEVYIGSFKAPSYGVWWDGRRLTYESFDQAYEQRQGSRRCAVARAVAALLAVDGRDRRVGLGQAL